MPRDRSRNLIDEAIRITDGALFHEVIDSLKIEALRHLETDNLKAYGQDNLKRDRAVLEYQIVCAFEKKFLDYARRK